MILELVNHHCQISGHRVIHTLHPAIVNYVVEASGNFSNAKKRVCRLRKPCAYLEAVGRECAALPSPEGSVPVDENVSRALGCKLGSCDRVHVGSAAETINEKQDVGVPSGRDRKGAEVIDAKANARLFGQGHRMTGHRTVLREVVRAWYFRQWQSHHQAQMPIPIHQ